MTRDGMLPVRIARTHSEFSWLMDEQAIWCRRHPGVWTEVQTFVMPPYTYSISRGVHKRWKPEGCFNAYYEPPVDVDGPYIFGLVYRPERAVPWRRRIVVTGVLK